MEVIQISFEALKRETWSAQESENVKLIIEFMQKLMNDHDFPSVLQRFENSHYKQHNRNIPDGMKALVKYVEGFVKKFPDYTYDVKRIHADGDFVVFHSHITTHKKDRGDDTKGINVSDTWRVENGQIVEHWDTLQPMNGLMRFIFWLTGGKIANSNGVY